MKQLVKTIYGSHLYGLNTSNSDMDYKGVYLPDLDDVLMYGPKKTIRESTGGNDTKNTSDDVDFENISLQFFLRMACTGQTIAIDMLHTPKEFVLQSSWPWEFLRDNRSQFYTSKMDAYLSYCQHQAAKYGIKGSRMNTVKAYIDILEQLPLRDKLSDHWDVFPEMEHSRIYMSESNRLAFSDIPTLEICGRAFQNTIRVEYTLVQLNKIYENYGERTRKAQNNENIDWKAICHAFRAGYELKEIYKTGDLIYPLKDRDFLMKVKTGQFHYQNDGIADLLENLIEEIKELSEKSSYPEKCDLDKWKKFVFDVYNEN